MMMRSLAAQAWIGAILFAAGCNTTRIDGDDFQHGTHRWVAEFEHGGTVTAKAGDGRAFVRGKGKLP